MSTTSQEPTPIPLDESAVPTHWQKDQLSGHEYDGIQEYDNPTPAWWTVVFITTVFFSFFYFVYYHSGVPNRSVKDDWAYDYAADVRKRFATMGELTVTEANMLQWAQKPDYLAVGQSTFKQNCVSCHGGEGQGLVGPNLTDDYYKNIKKMTDIAKVITNGAANGNMPAQGSRLHPNELALVATYLMTLRGQNLPDASPIPKYGEVIPPWPTVAATQPK